MSREEFANRAVMLAGVAEARKRTWERTERLLRWQVMGARAMWAGALALAAAATVSWLGTPGYPLGLALAIPVAVVLMGWADVNLHDVVSHAKVVREKQNQEKAELMGLMTRMNAKMKELDNG